MSKQEKKDQTQEVIKETAKNLFFVQGKFDATTQEIADEAGVNRTLINYYFRSRDNLMQIVFDEAQKVEREKSEIIQDSSLAFKDKIKLFIEGSLSTSLKYPYLETYIVSQINKGTCHKKDIEEFFHNFKYTWLAKNEKENVSLFSLVNDSRLPCWRYEARILFDSCIFHAREFTVIF